jgi:hypothetical protein
MCRQVCDVVEFECTVLRRLAKHREVMEDEMTYLLLTEVMTVRWGECSVLEWLKGFAGVSRSC